MAIPATVKFFGQDPTTVVMRCSSDFDGGAYTFPTDNPEITPGQYLLPIKASECGLYDFHDKPVEVLEISYTGGGTLTITKVSDRDGTAIETPVDSTAGNKRLSDPIHLHKGDALKFVTSGATDPRIVVTGKEAGNRYGAGSA